MDDLAHADRGQVAVALVGEDDPVGQDALDTGRHGGGASVRGFDEIGVEIVVGKHRAANGRDANGLIDHAHLFQHFGHEAVCHTVGAARAVMGGCICKSFRPVIDQVVW